MLRTINESDWKLVRKLKPVALERLCHRILDEVADVSVQGFKTYHERCLASDMAVFLLTSEAL